MKVCCIVFVCSNQGVYYLVIFDHISDMRCFEVYIYNDYSWLLLCRLYVEMLVLIIWCWRHLRVWSIISSADVWQISMSCQWVAFTVQCWHFRWDQESLPLYFYFFNKMTNSETNLAHFCVNYCDTSAKSGINFAWDLEFRKVLQPSISHQLAVQNSIWLPFEKTDIFLSFWTIAFSLTG